uniref:Peroxiredoxin-5, mitochondrial n=1 Tax=Hucho hucho TaxID=62062 RepID=A0A4W5LCX2_9TELE
MMFAKKILSRRLLLAGKVTLVNFWATWCAPCRKEMPLLSALAPRLAARQVKFVGIALDQPAEVAAFLKQVPVSYPILMSDGEGIALMRTLGNRSGGLPFTVLLDEQGQVLTRLSGLLSEAELMKALPLR